MTDFFFYVSDITHVCKTVTFLEKYITDHETSIHIHLDEIVANETSENSKYWFVRFSAGKILPKSERDLLDLAFKMARVGYDGWGQSGRGILFKAGASSGSSSD